MLDKITCAEFQAIYIELTSDQSVSETKVTQEVDEHVCLIMNNLTPNLAKDLWVNNAHKSKFDIFWDICKVLEGLTAVNNRCYCPGSEETGEVVVNMAVAISAPSLYQKCKTEALKSLSEEETLSLSWFKLQFWPKNIRAHAALKYTGCFKIKYMMQKQMIHKQHNNCACIYKYLQSMAVELRDISSFICTDDKHKIPIGEPGYPLSALPRGRRVLLQQMNLMLETTTSQK